MEKEKMFWRRCPIKGCRTISGFSIPQIEIDKDKKYFCQDCGKEKKISMWIESNEGAMHGQIAIRKGRDKFLDSMCIYLNLSKGTKADAIRIIKEVEGEWQINKRQAKSIMGGAVYLASLLNAEKQNQDRIARIIGISVPTLRKTFWKIVESKVIKERSEERKNEKVSKL